MERVHVVAAAISDGADRVLIARRPSHVHQGDRWEFPGGKVEPGESAEQALERELFEELGIRPRRARPLIRLAHDYADKAVLLEAWRVESYSGEAHAREGQPLRWVPVAELQRYTFPAANRAIISALQLPSLVLVTPPPEVGEAQFLAHLGQAVERHALELVYLRAPALAADRYAALARQALGVCHERGARLMLAAPAARVKELGAQGMHLPSAELARHRSRPIGRRWRLSVACHDARELALAARLSPDFGFLSPVKPTPGHPHARALGWPAFAELAAAAAFPVYALGGMTPGDVARAQASGAQGVAAVRALWD